MAKNSTTTSSPPDVKLLPDQIRQRIERLRRRVADVEGFEPESVQERWAPETKTIETAIEETLARVFGQDTPAYRRYQSAADLDRGGLEIGGGPDPLHKVHQWLCQLKPPDPEVKLMASHRPIMKVPSFRKLTDSGIPPD